MPETRLAMAMRHVAEQKERIAKQEALIGRLAAGVWLKTFEFQRWNGRPGSKIVPRGFNVLLTTCSNKIPTTRY